MRRIDDEHRFYRIQLDVSSRSLEVLLVAHEAIEVVGLPEFARSPNLLVNLARGEPLYRADDLGQALPRRWSDKNVNVIGHNHVRVKNIASSMAKAIESPTMFLRVGSRRMQEP